MELIGPAKNLGNRKPPRPLPPEFSSSSTDHEIILGGRKGT
jgi:hypothetical protein